MVEYNSWEKKKSLKNTKEVVVEFEGRRSAEVGRQEKLNMAEEKGFRRGKLLEKYITKMLYR